MTARLLDRNLNPFGFDAINQKNGGFSQQLNVSLLEKHGDVWLHRLTGPLLASSGLRIDPSSHATSAAPITSIPAAIQDPKGIEMGQNPLSETSKRSLQEEKSQKSSNSMTSSDGRENVKRFLSTDFETLSLPSDEPSSHNQEKPMVPEELGGHHRRELCSLLPMPGYEDGTTHSCPDPGCTLRVPWADRYMDLTTGTASCIASADNWASTHVNCYWAKNEASENCPDNELTGASVSSSDSN